MPTPPRAQSFLAVALGLSASLALLIACSGSSALTDDADCGRPGGSCSTVHEGTFGVPDGAAPSVPFLALNGSFEGFEKWPSFDLGNHIESDDVHLAGPRRVYINKLPPPGATEFPVGTVMVKVVQTSPDRSTWQVFGMSKRGGDFNPLGAVGWEWFGLGPTASGVKIEWRGHAPPADAGYGGGGNGACNRCHGVASSTDFVLSPPLWPSIGGAR